jgi:predicted transposase YdaD
MSVNGEALNMYNNLWDQSPIIQQMKAASRAEGEGEGEAKGEIKGLQNGIVDVVTAHFPLLADLARQRVAQMNDTKNLRGLLVQISTVPDEARARLLLAPIEA